MNPTAPDVRIGRILGLHRHGARPAVVGAHGTLDFDELAARAADVAADWGTGRRLVALGLGRDLDSLVALVAALEHDHVALLLPADRPDQLERAIAAYDPDVVVTPAGTVHRRAVDAPPAHDLHPELALLLTTSGSTGSPKLVRLSAEGLRSNAAAIAEVLGLGPDDRAITSLPLHYCYGLSVVTSHLVRGGSVRLCDASVAEPAFWSAMSDVTTLAAVPYTVDLLDRAGLADRELPALRRVTQAGGRLAPERVQHHARLGAERGWDLVVMYGQTEATARMAMLPPHLADRHPSSVGRAIPGGTLRVEPVGHDDPEVGELVYEGPNVMLGYARTPADLARGRDVTTLRTGDLARIRDGLVEIVGRRDRVAKPFGLRLDLDDLERLLHPVAPAWTLMHDERLHVVTEERGRLAALRRRTREATGLPDHAVRVVAVASLPRTSSGKPDRAALERLLDQGPDQRPDQAPEPGVGPAGSRPERTLADEVALVLGRGRIDADRSFVELGGDSLSYVELATRVGRRLHRLPDDWHRLPVRELERLAAATAERAATRTGTDRRPRAVRRLDGMGAIGWLRPVPTEVSVLVRAAAIVLIVGTHTQVWEVRGGAHALLALLGFNLARFRLADPTAAARVRGLLRSATHLLVPTALVAGAVVLTTGQYRWPTPLMLNGLLGSDAWTDDWHLWFVEAAFWLVVGTAALLAVPGVDRLERRRPFALPIGLAVAGLVVRYAWTGVEAGTTERCTPGVIAWIFALGWAAARADTARRRLLVTLLGAVGLAGLFDDPQRELIVLAGLALLTWVRSVRVPSAVATLAGGLAGASLWIYLTHWQVFERIDDPLAGFLASFGVGLAAWWAVRRGRGVLVAARPAVRAARRTAPTADARTQSVG
ncbi:AMP-binding protein [Nocardioides sp. TRM66260-LWL]|uniref:AMP-binding protein n=1 Tax=Nocardioides sp. TRM66260-LWL TaxID=2874478 RepID=UPI001CC649D5|nr:AMP-binding protein [Nocardioides sp. TRM66260-LWL]MBZ5732972.1 AMP-binding protein [Nocardioides sp. TRM66260-LWL]